MIPFKIFSRARALQTVVSTDCVLDCTYKRPDSITWIKSRACLFCYHHVYNLKFLIKSLTSLSDSKKSSSLGTWDLQFKLATMVLPSNLSLPHAGRRTFFQDPKSNNCHFLKTYFKVSFTWIVEWILKPPTSILSAIFALKCLNSSLRKKNWEK